ncbi:hypothetical protein L7F22_066083 [Adiantum nelumboides]|nr:hypothetical protein [Adiantum nelumboides]
MWPCSLDVVEPIIDDYDKGYFVTRNVSSGVYVEDCKCADPPGSFKSMKCFNINCSYFGSLLENFDVKLVKSKESHDKFVAYWSFSCVLKFPWRPILPSTAFTKYYFNAKTGRIYRHVENWDVLKMALLRQVFKPNLTLKRDWFSWQKQGSQVWKRTRQHAVEQAFIAAQRKGGNSNATTSHGSFASGKSPICNASTSSHSSRNFGDKGKNKMRCHYCKANDHLIKQCLKLKAKEAKKKEGGSTKNAAIIESSMRGDYDVDVYAE